VYTVSGGLIGVNIATLAAGSYGYRISYTRAGASSAFARQEGTFNPGTGVVTPTSATALQAQTVTPSTQQSFDRWGNVVSVKDSSGNLTQYRYNQLNLLTQTLLPTTRLVDTRVSIEESVGRAVSSNRYDLHGRLMDAQDAMGRSTRATYNSVGQLLVQTNADDSVQTGGSKKRYVYDAYGNVLQTTDELGFRSRNVYDKVDNLVTTVREAQLNIFALATPSDISVINNALAVKDTYSYDEAGRRISETNGELESIKYWYDLRGNLLRRRTPRNFDTTYEYDAFSRKTRETDPNQSFSTWAYDAFGRMTGHAELTDAGPLATYFQGGGTTHTYAYDNASQLTSDTTSLGVSRILAYDSAGHLLSLTETGTPGAGVPLTAVNRTTTFGYDAAGRKARERVVVDTRVHQDTRTEYDELGRIASVDDPDYRVRYSYDANGNRTRIQASYLDHQLVSRSEDLYYRYDAMNRVTISQGYRTPGAVPDIEINSTQGIRITYDTKGQRTSARTLGKRFAANEYRTNGVYQYTLYAEITPTDGLATEYYSYDGLGRLTTLGRETDLVIRETTTGNVIGGSWTSTVIGERQYDKASRQTQERTYSVEGTSLVMRQTATVFDDDGRATTQQTSKSGLLESVVQYGDTGTSGAALYQGYDTAGLLHGYTVEVYLNGTYRYTTTYQNTYRLADSYLEVLQSASSVGTGAPLAGSTTRSYDLNGHLVKFVDSKDVTRTRYFANNAEGQALTVIQGQFDGASGRMTVAQAWDAALARSQWAGQYNQPKAQHFFFTDGKYVGSFGQLQAASGTFDANFDVNYTPISADYPASTPSQVVAQAGDTLRTIAARVFGDAALWYVIAEENGLSDPNAVLTEGTALQVPNDVISLGNTAGSFKPFSASEAIGDTTPTQPAPPAPKPKKKGCGVLGTILVVIVAIVVTVFTAGVAAPGAAGSFASIMSTGVSTLASGSIGAAALGGAVGSIASQGVAMALGMQQGFDWKGVALGAIGAGVTAGLGASGAFARAVGTISQGNTYAAAAINAVAGNSITQGIAVATGLQSSFSWRDVAISAVAAPVAAFASAQAGRALSGATAGVADFGQRVAGSIAGSVVRRQFGGKVDAATIIADAFGNALGDAIVDKMQPIGLTADQYDEMNRQIEEAYQASQAQFDDELQLDLQQQQFQISLELGLERSLNNNPEFFANLPVPVLQNTNEATAAEFALEEVTVTGKRLPPLLTMDDLNAMRANIVDSPREQLSPGVRVLDRDALTYALGSYDGRIREAEFAAREAFRKTLNTAEAFNEGDAQLVVAFAEGMSPEDKLRSAIQVGGGYFTDEVAANLLGQINAGADALDLTYVRGQSEAYLDAIVEASGLRSEVTAELMRSSHEVFAESIDRAVEQRLDLLRGEDALLPQRLSISEKGVMREVRRAVDLALLVSGIGDMVALAPYAIMRAAAPKRLSELAFDAHDFRFTDAMSDKNFTKLVKSVRANGFENPVIKYTIVNDKPYIVVGNNRFLAAQRLNRLNDLRFQRVDFPVAGTNFRTAQDVLDTVGTVKLPKYRSGGR
jgi:YD repeat-containing protein